MLCRLIQYPVVTSSNKEQGKFTLQMHWDRGELGRSALSRRRQQMSIRNNGPAQDLANRDSVVTKFGRWSPPGFAELDEMLIGNRLSFPGCARLNSDRRSQAQHDTEA